MMEEFLFSTRVSPVTFTVSSCKKIGIQWLFLDDIAAKTGFMVTEKGERAFQGTFYAARFLLNEQDF